MIAALLSYFASRWFVSSALRDLTLLAKKVEQLHIDDLDLDVDFSHLPEHDELRTIADAVHDMSKNLQQQIANIK